MVINQVISKVQSLLSRICNGLYEIIAKKRLKNENFSIICSNCVGGVISHRLGQEFLSPTVNLWMHQPDFLKFVFNLREYVNKDLVFVKSEYNYPVAKLGDILIYFNHSKSIDDAASDWNRRKLRINYDNLYVIMYDRDGITENDILSLRELRCHNLVVFSEKKHEGIDYVVTIKPTNRPDGQQFMDKDWLGFRTFEKHFDFVKWLNA